MRKTFKLNDIDCQHCADEIEEHLNKLHLVDSITIDYLHKTITIEDDEINNDLLTKLNKEIQKIEDETYIILEEENEQKSNNILKISRYLFACLFFLLGNILTNFNLWLFLISYLLFGYDIIIKCFKNICKGRIFDENFLMTIATFGAFAIGEYKEAIFVILFYKAGEYLQDKAVDKSKESISNLLALKKHTIDVYKNGEYIETNLDEINIGDVFICKPGDVIPIDGIIIEGESFLDLSSLTGEDEDILKKTGDEVLSGSIVKKSILKIKATKKFKDSTVSKILDIVENSSNSKSSTEKFITRFSFVYTPIVCLLALFIFVFPVFVLGLPIQEWGYKALSFLVVSCPCALVISIPLSFFSGIGNASKNGILIKGSSYLDLVPKINTFAFDKTGTLTNGKFTVNKIDFLTEDKNIIDICYSLEKNSTHPIAKSIVEKTKEMGAKILEIDNFEEISGKGVKGSYKGDVYCLGNSKFGNIKSDEDVICLFKNDNIVSKIYIEDGIKKGAKETIEYLNSLNKNTIMLTGDNYNKGNYIANKLNIKEFYCELLPLGKFDIIKKKMESEKVLFVGDGLNDAPVLSQSNIGVAIGSTGSDASIETADIVLLKNGDGEDINKIVTLLKLSKFTKKIIVENISLALLTKILVMVLICLGVSSMWMAIFADTGISLICVLNTLRILRKKF